MDDHEMDRGNFIQSTNVLFQFRPDDWPPAPKVKEYDENGIEIPRVETQTMAELKRGNAVLLFDKMNTAQIADSISTVEFQRSLPTRPKPTPTARLPVKKVNMAVEDGSLDAIAEGVSKLLEDATRSSSIETDDSAPGNLAKPRKKRAGTDEPSRPKRRTVKNIPRMSRLALWDYLKSWDNGSNSNRMDLIHKFLDDYCSQDPLDLDLYLSKGGSLIFTRFLVGLQITFQCKKPVAHHFLALGIFIKSLSGERYTYEFGLAGGFQTTFEVLRVTEMTNHDKMHAFHFLYSIIDGSGGGSAKRFLCSETSYLECVVDCLTMCQNESVIKEARLFLENLCIGNTNKNLYMISKYIISLLPCDFNPRIQAMACYVLQGIVNQNPDVAATCYTLVVDVLKSDYDDALVDVGNVCIAIMGTPTADDLLYDLITAAQPYSLLENLTTPGVTSRPGSVIDYSEEGGEESGEESSKESRTTQGIEHDPYFRLQYGAVYVLSYMVKNRPEFAQWMIDRGVIGSLLAGIGTPLYTFVQLESIRLLLLLHEFSPDCAVTLPSLLPEKLLGVLLTEQEEMLQYVTAVMCIILRRLGARVQENWSVWFTQVSSAAAGEDTFHETNLAEIQDEEKDDPSDIIHEIETLVELLEQSLSDPFMTIADKMKLIFPEPSVIDAYREGGYGQTRSAVLSHPTSQRFVEKFSPGEEHIQETEALEPFRKYLRKDNVIPERVDEFEKYYAAKFIMASEKQSMDLGAMQVAALQDAEKALKSFKDPLKVGESFSKTEKEGDDQQQNAHGTFNDSELSELDHGLNL